MRIYVESNHFEPCTLREVLEGRSDVLKIVDAHGDTPEGFQSRSAGCVQETMEAVTRQADQIGELEVEVLGEEHAFGLVVDLMTCL